MISPLEKPRFLIFSLSLNRMTELIACLFEGEGTRKHVLKLIESEEWEKVLLITDEQNKNGFPQTKNTEFVVIAVDTHLSDMIEEIKQDINQKIVGPEVGLNMISGSGKVHMAVLSALLKSGFGIRLVALTKDGVKEV